MLRALVPIAAASWFLVPSTALGVTFRELFEDLMSNDYATRFEAALNLVLVPYPAKARVLSGAIRDGHFKDSSVGVAAAEFVMLKLSGESLGHDKPPAAPGTHVFLISIDTLRADHLGCYGYPRGSSPTIDRLAEEGARFTTAVSPSSWTLPAHMSIFTSLYPAFHKLEKGGHLGSVRLDDSEPMLTEILKSAGFTTVGFVAHPFLSEEWGFDRGFDFYKRYSTRADQQAQRALLWLEWHRFHVDRGLASPNFFLFLHFIDPHETYSPPSPYRDKYFPDYRGPRQPSDKFVTLYKDEDFETQDDFRYALALYDGEINFVDEQLKLILAKLREIGSRDSTMIILTSDHGEEFKDHGSMGHQTTLYEEQLKVPLIITYPRGIEAGQTIGEQVSLVDVFPTILEIVGKKPSASLQGISLVPYLGTRHSAKRAPTRAPRSIFAELHPADFSDIWDFYKRAIRVDRYKLIRSYYKDGRVANELYDLAEDPEEKVNLYGTETGESTRRELEAELMAFMTQGASYNPGSGAENRIELDEETREQLRALGYLE